MTSARVKRSLKHGSGHFRTASVTLVLIILILFHGNTTGSNDLVEISEKKPYPVINEVYPNPDLDINGDGDTDQDDEFVELFNPSDTDLEVKDYSLSDNTGTYTIPNKTIRAGSHLILGRWETGLVLGRDDQVTLCDQNGSIIDHFEFRDAGKGDCYQRSPDGNERWISGTKPTPGLENSDPPSFIINEVLADPEGSNSGNQWLELKNTGPDWNIEGFVLTNHDALEFVLPDHEIRKDERFLIHLGSETKAPDVPEDIKVICDSSSSTLYSSGDDLEFLDSDGYALDFVAWGNSTHVDRSTGKGMKGQWSGEFYDKENSTMSGDLRNPAPVTGRTMMRIHDGRDTDSPADFILGPELTGGTPGWNNSIDPGLELDLPEGPLNLNEGEKDTIFLNISSSGTMRGNISILYRVTDENWTVSLSRNKTAMAGGRENRSIGIEIEAPDDLRISNKCDLNLMVAWEDLPFLPFQTTLKMQIPSFDVALEDMVVELDGFPTSIFPEGSYIEISGKVICDGEIPGGDLFLMISLLKENETEMEEVLEFKDLRASSRRTFSVELDTIYLEGNLTLIARMDFQDKVREPDEDNNLWSEEIQVIPTTLSDSSRGLVITEVLWNYTSVGCFVTVNNTGPESVDISHMRLYFDDCFVSFPDEASIPSRGNITVAWGEEALEKIGDIGKIFRTDGKGPVDFRMSEEEDHKDPMESDILRLMTRYRDLIDEVTLKREAIENGTNNMTALFPETTWGSILNRRSDSNGLHIDTDSYLDWTVDPVRASITTLLVDPGPDGPGEFIGITPDDKSNDLSGLVLSRGDGLLVIPDEYSRTPGETFIAREPESFDSKQLFLPELAFEDNEREIPSCSVPGFRTISLPNGGGEVTLLDRGNRIIEKVCWGNSDSLDPGRGVIISRRSSIEGPSNWMKRGTGDLPMNGKWSFSNRSILEAGSGGLPDLVTGDDSEKVSFLLPGLTVEYLARTIMDIREDGNQVKLYIFCPPWDRDPSLQIHTGLEKEMGWFRHLEDVGVKIFFPEDPKDQWCSGSVITQNRLVSFNVPRNGRTEEIRWDMIAFDGGSSSIFELSEDFREQEDWFDASPMLSEYNRIEPGSFDENNTVDHVNECDSSICWAVDPSIYTVGSGRISILHTTGGLDLSTIMELLQNGSSVDLSISSSLLRMENEDALEKIFEEENRITSVPPLHSIGDLNSDFSCGLAALERISQERGYDLRLSMMDISNGTFEGRNIWSWGTGYACTTSTHLDETVPCWIICNLKKGTRHISQTFNNPFPKGFLPGNSIIKGQKIVIDKIYFDTYLKEDPDEAICLLNCGSEQIDISGFIITDDEGEGRNSDGLWMIPPNTSIDPAREFWITRDGGRFHYQFGFHADLAFLNSTCGGYLSGVYGDLRLANSNDTVSLRDPMGNIVDVVPYGESTWKSVWPHHDGGNWSGPSASAPGWGKILHRWKGWDQVLPEDRNSAEDFTLFRNLYPGVSDLPRFGKVEAENVDAAVCPDSGWSLLKRSIAESNSRILFNVYEMTSDWIVSSLIGARERGIEVKVILEGGPVGGRSYTSEILADRLTENGITVRWMSNDFEKDIRDRYRYDHAKYLVIDGKTTLVSTDNFKDSSFPNNGDILEGTRGWMVSVTSKELASQMEKIFFGDWNGPDMMENTVDYLQDYDQSGNGILQAETDEPRFSLFSANSSAEVQVLVCPDHISTPGNPLIRAIEQAESSIFLELMDIDEDFNLQGKENTFELEGSWGVKEPVKGMNNPYLAALFDAAGRGVRVRILLDGSDFNGDGIPENMETANLIGKAVDELGLSNNFRVRLHPPSRMDNYCDISLIHSKGMVIDGNKTWISSFNWGPTSGLDNREVGLMIDSQEIASFYTSVMDHDWGGTIQNDLTADLKQIRFWTEEDIPVARVAMEIDWNGEQCLNFSFENGREGSEPFVIGGVEGDYDGIFRQEVAIRDAKEGDLIVICATSEERTMELFEVTVGFNEEDSREPAGFGFNSSFTPLIIIAVITIGISLSRVTVKELKERFKTLRGLQEE